MVPHVNTTIRNIYFHLKRIHKIRKNLDFATSAKIIHAIITSRLDSCNSVLVGLPDNIINKLQVAQNSAARVLTGTKRREHITPVLRELHWLPVRTRVNFKLLCIIHKVLFSGIAPSYLSDLISVYSQSRALRSNADGSRLKIQRSKNKYGDKLMSSGPAKTWNSLPQALRESDFDEFKSGLKTFLFNQFF